MKPEHVQKAIFSGDRELLSRCGKKASANKIKKKAMREKFDKLKARGGDYWNN